MWVRFALSSEEGCVNTFILSPPQPQNDSRNPKTCTRPPHPWAVKSGCVPCSGWGTAAVLYLIWQADNQVIFRLPYQGLQEVLAAGGQHSPVGAELLPLHDERHVAENILLALVI